MPTPRPTCPLDRISQTRGHAPVDEHHQNAAGLAYTPCITEPFCTPACPAALIFLISSKFRQSLVTAQTAVLLARRAVLFGRLDATAGVGRISDDRIKNAGFERLDNAQHIPVQDGPAIITTVFDVELGIRVHDQVQFIGFTQRHPSFLIAPVRGILVYGFG